MNLTVPVVSGRLRRKSIAAEVVHCITDLRLDSDEGVSSNHHHGKHGSKRRGSLGGEPVRRPSLVSRWFRHISEAADAYKLRKGAHDYSEDTSGVHGQQPKDSFETVTETQKIEQTSTPIDRLERKDSSHQCRAVSTSRGPVGSHGGGHTTVLNSHASVGGGGLNNNEDSLPNKNHHRTAAVDENDDNVENEEKELIKRQSLLAAQDVPSDDDRPKDEADEQGGQQQRGRGGVVNNTRTLTQQCSLVAPGEIHVSVSSALTAEPVLTPSEKLRRLDLAIRKTLVEKQRVVCDMFKVPDEHFLAIADIAGQPEAPQKEPTDIILAAFSHIQSLTDVLNEHMRVTQSQEISAVSTSVCDECNCNVNGGVAVGSNGTPPSSGVGTSAGQPELNGLSAIDPANSSSSSISSSGNSQITTVGVPPIGAILQQQGDQVNITEDEDGYCEIDEVRAAAVLLESQREAEKLKKAEAEAKAAAAAAATADSSATLDDSGGGPKSPDSHIEINDNYDSTQNHLQPKFIGVDLCGRNRLLHASSLVPTVPCHLIASYVSGLNAQISQLLPKISERDLEREQLRRENQQLRELLNAMHQERVLETQETTEAPVLTDPEPSAPEQPPQQQEPSLPQPSPAPPPPSSEAVIAVSNVNE